LKAFDYFLNISHSEQKSIIMLSYLFKWSNINELNTVKILLMVKHHKQTRSSDFKGVFLLKKQNHLFKFTQNVCHCILINLSAFWVFLSFLVWKNLTQVVNYIVLSYLILKFVTRLKRLSVVPWYREPTYFTRSLRIFFCSVFNLLLWHIFSSLS
jgi:hypothetical protein